MIASPLGEQIKILLDEEANESGPERADLGHAVIPHRFLGKTALAEGHVVNVQRAEPLGEGYLNLGGGLSLGRKDHKAGCEDDRKAQASVRATGYPKAHGRAERHVYVAGTFACRGP